MLTVRTILILVAVIVADGAIAQSPKEPLIHPNQSKEAPEPDKRGTEQAPFIVKTIPTPKTEAETAAEAQDKQEKAANDRQLVYWTRALVGVGVVQFLVLVVQAFVFGFQARRLRQTVEEMKIATKATEKSADAAKNSADASLIALRPWLSCEVQIADSLTYTPEGDASFAFKFIVKNVGHSPAMNISFLPHLTLLSPKHELSLIYLQRMADIYRSMPPKMTTMIIPGGSTGISEPGLLLFPGEHFTFNYTIPLKRSEIEKACEDIKPQTHFFPELCGLITYTYPLATVRADTGFILRVEKALADGRRGDVLKLDEPVLLENMRLSDHGLWGGFAT